MTQPEISDLFSPHGDFFHRYSHGLQNFTLRNSQLANLSSLPFANLPHLALLDVSDNQLNSLDTSPFTEFSLPSLTTLILDGNKLAVDILNHL
jgi:Leucine-rich repeat (LRR) protein